MDHDELIAAIVVFATASANDYCDNEATPDDIRQVIASLAEHAQAQVENQSCPE